MLREHRLYVPQKNPSRIGKLDSFPAFGVKLGAVVLLQKPKLFGCRRLADVEFSGGEGNVAMPCDGCEKLEVIEAH